MKNVLIKQAPVFFLQAIIILIGVGTLAFLLVEPHFEGRNVNATLFEVYFNDPFLAYAYIGSTPFFLALYQTFTLLGYIGQDKASSRDAMRAIRTTKYCGVALVAFIIPPVAYLMIVRPEDDIAGGVAMGLFAIVFSLIMAAVAAVIERKLRTSR